MENIDSLENHNYMDDSPSKSSNCELQSIISHTI